MYARGYGSYATACPGPDLQSALDWIVDRAIDLTTEGDDEMQPWNIADESTLVGGKHVNGTRCATIFPAAFFGYQREIPTPAGKVEDAVTMSRRYGAHETVSHDIFEGLRAAFAAAEIGEVTVKPDPEVVKRLTAIEAAIKAPRTTSVG